jgi:hypothetical protein
MGTNYYWYPLPPCESCGREFDKIHIGKSSAGWCFSLHVLPEDMINSLDDWIYNFRKKRSYIKDEYGKIVHPEEMLDIIKKRSWNPSGKFTMDWYRHNYAEPGPNNLARSSIDGIRCIGHGEGTWDLIQGEFS